MRGGREPGSNHGSRGDGNRNKPEEGDGRERGEDAA